MDEEPDKAPPVAAAQMRHWLSDPDFNSVRHPAALEKLPEPEREAWRALWSDVQQTLTSTRQGASPEAKTAEKSEPPG